MAVVELLTGAGRVVAESAAAESGCGGAASSGGKGCDGGGSSREGGSGYGSGGEGGGDTGVSLRDMALALVGAGGWRCRWERW